MKIYEFETFKDFFQFHMRDKHFDSVGKKSLTDEQFAKKLGYSTPAIISLVASGQRLPTSDFLDRLFKFWKIPKLEQERVRLKIELERLSRKGKGNIELTDKYSSLAPYHKINLKQHKLISDWYVLVIKVLMSCPDFIASEEFIYRKLRKKVSIPKIRKALELLVESKLVVKEGSRYVVNQERTETPHEIPSEAIRANHKAMLQLAAEAIEEQAVLRRQFNSISLQFDKGKLSEAKQTILNFVKQFNDQFSSETSNSVYQLNVQLFEHTDGEIHE